LVEIDILNKEKDRPYNPSYRIDYKNQQVSIYNDIENFYIGICGDGECTMTNSLIKIIQRTKNKIIDSSEYTIINRWTGKYGSYRSYAYEGKLQWNIRTLGECVPGVSKLKTRPKF